jgi:hypothetical protein
MIRRCGTLAPAGTLAGVVVFVEMLTDRNARNDRLLQYGEGWAAPGLLLLLGFVHPAVRLCEQCFRFPPVVRVPRDSDAESQDAAHFRSA